MTPTEIKEYTLNVLVKFTIVMEVKIFITLVLYLQKPVFTCLAKVIQTPTNCMNRHQQVPLIKYDSGSG